MSSSAPRPHQHGLDFRPIAPARETNVHGVVRTKLHVAGQFVKQRFGVVALDDDLRDGTHLRRSRFQACQCAFVGSGQRPCNYSAGRDDAVWIREHTQGDDTWNLFRLGEVERKIFGDFSRLDRDDADVWLSDVARSRDLQRTGADCRRDVELPARVDGQLDLTVSCVAARADDPIAEQPRIGRQRPERPVSGDLQRDAFVTLSSRR